MMKLTSVSLASFQPQDPVQAAGLGKTLSQANQSFQALTQSLMAGDTSNARSSFADLKKLLQSAGSIGAANSIQNDFTKIGEGIGSGTLSPAAPAKSPGGLPGLPVRLPGGPLYQVGLSAAKSIGHMLA